MISMVKVYLGGIKVTNWHEEVEARKLWLKDILQQSGAKGIVLGLSGGKDSSVVAALARSVCPTTLGLIMPCGNIPQDRNDALQFAKIIGLTTDEIDLYSAWQAMLATMNLTEESSPLAQANIKPRLRMTCLYAKAQSLGYLVAGTSNRSERVMGYFTKWGDAGCDFNPIGDLTVREVIQLGLALNIPEHFLLKPPSAGLWEGQTDEQEMGITYETIDNYLLNGLIDPESQARIHRAYQAANHKLTGVKFYKEPLGLPE